MNAAVIGATGSVPTVCCASGSSVLAVCEAWPERIRVVGLAANRSSQKLQALADKFRVSIGCVLTYLLLRVVL
ncbi:MAG: hypothetical protein IJS39_05265 [Synergistaceae bacterium]|nr:hypothetical protein [Synergistaceae bacterium]